MAAVTTSLNVNGAISGMGSVGADYYDMSYIGDSRTAYCNPNIQTCTNNADFLPANGVRSGCTGTGRCYRYDKLEGAFNVCVVMYQSIDQPYASSSVQTIGNVCDQVNMFFSRSSYGRFDVTCDVYQKTSTMDLPTIQGNCKDQNSLQKHIDCIFPEWRHMGCDNVALIDYENAFNFNGDTGEKAKSIFGEPGIVFNGDQFFTAKHLIHEMGHGFLYEHAEQYFSDPKTQLDNAPFCACEGEETCMCTSGYLGLGDTMTMMATIADKPNNDVERPKDFMARIKYYNGWLNEAWNFDMNQRHSSSTSVVKLVYAHDTVDGQPIERLLNDRDQDVITITHDFSSRVHPYNSEIPPSEVGISELVYMVEYRRQSDCVNIRLVRTLGSVLTPNFYTKKESDSIKYVTTPPDAAVTLDSEYNTGPNLGSGLHDTSANYNIGILIRAGEAGCMRSGDEFRDTDSNFHVIVEETNGVFARVRVEGGGDGVYNDNLNRIDQKNRSSAISIIPGLFSLLCITGLSTLF
eukprot:Pgem_evm1s857